MKFIDFLKTDENARKVFGKAEIKIIEKQLYGVDLTQSEKNRLSRDIRKKLEFIKEAAKYSDEFELKKADIIEHIVKSALDVILNSLYKRKIKSVVLYGSACDKTLSLSSDIDLAVEFFEISLKDSTLFRKSILGQASERVDLQVYNYLPDRIKKEIDKKGRVLYKHED
ncbi:MAG: nucleotidyltransferase domain-containing protein [archaeon]